MVAAVSPLPRPALGLALFDGDIQTKGSPLQMKLVMVHMCRITQAAQTGRGEFHIMQTHWGGRKKKKRKEEAGHAPVSSGGNKRVSAFKKKEKKENCLLFVVFFLGGGGISKKCSFKILFFSQSE